MGGPEPKAGRRPVALLVAGGLVAGALLAVGVALRPGADAPEEETVSEASPAPVEPRDEAEVTPALPAGAAPDVFEPEPDGTLTIPASALASGEPITVALQLRPEEIGDQPMTASLRTRGRTYEIGTAELDRDAGVARLAIAPDRLPPGQHLLAIRVADESWNPHRRVAITVTPD